MKTGFTKKAVIVGIFIFLGIVIFVTGVFTIGFQRKTFAKAIDIHILFNDISGLQEGNNVWLSGVKIGTVKTIRFHGDTQVEVVLRIDQEAQSHIAKDAKAKVGTDGFIGNRIVLVYGGMMSAGQIQSGDWLVSEKTLGTDELLASLQGNSKNLLEVTDNLKIISDRIREGKGTIGELINNPSVADNLRATLIHFNKASKGSEMAIAKINDYVNALNKKGTLINELTTDTTAYAHFKATMVQLNRASLSIAELADSLKQAGKSLSRTDNPAGVLLHDPQVASDLKAITRNLNASSLKLDEDLKALQSNFLFKGYFKNQEKQKKKEENKK